MERAWIRSPQSDPERLSPNADTPFIFVSSVADFVNRVRHSAWIRADQSPEEIQMQINQLLDASPSLQRGWSGASGWFIEDRRGFGSYEALLSYDAAEVSNVGRGIAAYGEPFAAYAMEHPGGGNLLSEFEEFYIATYSDVNDCIDAFLETMGWSQALTEFKAEQGINCPLEFDRSCIWEQYKEAWEVIETRNGSVHVFAT